MRNDIPKEEELSIRLRPKPDSVVQVEARLLKDSRLGINIGSLEGTFLQTLVSQKNVEKVVEIGTQYGCSTAYFADSLGPSGHIYALEKDQACLEEAQKTFDSEAFKMTGCKISLIPGDARESLRSIENKGPFDLVFIDANKSAYLDYYLWAREFLRPGGYLVADNVFLFGSVFEDVCPEGVPPKMWQKMKTFLQTLFEDEIFQSCLIPTKEGLSFSIKKES